MRKHCIPEPIGLEALRAEVREICSDARVYKRCGLRPPHFLVCLDPGAGRTTFVEYMADMYKEHGVIRFSGLDDYLELELDGTLQQLRQAFSRIDAAAVYTNEFTNIVAMDISGVAPHINETQFTEFISNTKRICSSACVVFFVRSVPSRCEEKLIEKLASAVGDLKRIESEPYTPENLCDLIVRFIENRGIVIDQPRKFCSFLQCAVMEHGIADVKGASSFAERIVRHADFSGFIPVVGMDAVISLAADRGSEIMEREAK